MAIYTVDVPVEKQAEHEACWASICMAVVAAVKPARKGMSPIDLYNQKKSTTQKAAQDPTKVLKDEFGVDCKETAFKAPVFNQGESNLRADEIEKTVVEALKKNSPVICGLTTHDDSGLPSTKGPITWRHATLAYKCDDQRHVCWIRDPAPGGGKASLADRLVTFDEMSSGFVYMQKSDFGPKTRELLGEVNSKGLLMARVYKLIVPSS